MSAKLQFYREENSKVVEADGFKFEVPKEWEVVRLGDKKIAKIRGNKSINNVENVAFIPMELIPDSGVYVRYEIRNLKEIKSSNYCEAGDLLLAKITPCFENGKQGIVPEDIPNGFAFTTTEVFPIVCRGIDKLFLFYILKHPKFRKTLERSMSGTTGRQRVPKKAVENLLIPLPPLEEQRKIAHVLMSIDKAIEAVDEAIKQAERIKKGLMQELLTKGIGHREFKDTEIGRIPKDWEVVRLGEVVEIQSGKYFAYSEFCESGIRCLKIDNIGFGKILWETTTFLPEEYLDKYPELVLGVGDIVLALNRPIINGKLKVGILSETDIPSILYQRVGRFIFKSERIYRHFMFYLLMGKYFKKELSKMLIGTDQPYIRTPVLLKIKIPLPPLDEQKKITQILSKWDEVIEVKKAKKEKLERMKKKVMELLLTGKVRVK